MKNSNQTVVLDFDDILVFHTELVFHAMKCHWGKYSLYLRNPGLLSREEIYNRPDFLLSEWLWQDDFFKLPEKKQKQIKDVVAGLFMEDCFKVDLYSPLLPTPFAEKTLRNPLYMDNSAIKKVYILTRNVAEEMRPLKEAYVKKWFPHEKIELVHISGQNKKSDFLREHHWDLFVDDEIRNIRDVAENCDIKDKEFLIPRYGYNKMPIDLSLLIQGKGGTFNYYEPFGKREA